MDIWMIVYRHVNTAAINYWKWTGAFDQTKVPSHFQVWCSSIAFCVWGFEPGFNQRILAIEPQLPNMSIRCVSYCRVW